MNEHSFIYKNMDKRCLPTFGFKIHVSATWKNFREIKQILQPILDEVEVPYKYLKNEQEVWTNFSVDESLAESGKFFTIYPENHQEFLDLLERLYRQLPSDLEGIYIVSDRPYKDSNILFYRYGTMVLDIKQTKNGHPILYGPNGEEWQDYQKAYFDLPEWIEDIQPDDTIEESYLSLNYEVDSIKKSSNGGNVYRGHRLNDNTPVILKESRPHILYLDELEKRKLRENEYDYISQLDNYVPKSLEKVTEWQHIYYVYEQITGEDFYSWSKQFNLFSYRSVVQEDFKKNLKKYKCFLDSLDKLFDVVSYFHSKGLVLNDIHTDNFIVDAQGKFYFIDLEHVYSYKENKLSGVYNEIALKSWNSLDGKVADCHKLANMILFSFGKLQITDFETSSDQLKILEKLLEQYGISTTLPQLLHYLLSPNASIDIAKEQLLYIKKTTSPSQQAYDLDFSQIGEINEGDNFINRVKRLNKTVTKYKSAMNDSNHFCYEVDRETTVGLSGLLGSLVLLKESLPQELMLYGLDRVKSQLVKTTSGYVLSIGNNAASPYFDKGNAGYIQALIYLDKEKYRTEIVDLADTFDFEFAQRPGYNDGMLGIVDSLLQVYDFIPDTRYLRKARTLLLNTSFYVKYGNVDSQEFEAILSRLQEREEQRAQST